MRIALLTHADAAEPAAIFTATNAREMRVGLSGHAARYVLAVEVSHASAPSEWRIIHPLVDGRPNVGKYLHTRGGLAPTAAAQAVMDAAAATVAYAREQAAGIARIANWART